MFNMSGELLVCQVSGATKKSNTRLGVVFEAYPNGWSRAGRSRRVLARTLDHTVAYRVCHYLGAVLDVQFVEDVAQVILDRVFADDQALRELTIAGNALDEQVEDFA